MGGRHFVNLQIGIAGWTQICLENARNENWLALWSWCLHSPTPASNSSRTGFGLGLSVLGPLTDIDDGPRFCLDFMEPALPVLRIPSLQSLGPIQVLIYRLPRGRNRANQGGGWRIGKRGKPDQSKTA